MSKQQEVLRPIKMTKHYTKYADGSVLIEVGDTKIICTAMVEEKVPPFLRGTGSGWVSAEYAMLPGSTAQRKMRDIAKGRLDGRSSEIQRLIGRGLRAVVHNKDLGERTIWIDCDVIQADGGTRTAAITGSFVAFALACKKMIDQGKIKTFPLKDYVSAISVGKVKNKLVLDLCYEEDSQAQVDMNLVVSGKEELIEVQGTAEGKPFTREEMNAMLDLAVKGCKQIHQMQKEILGEEIHHLITSSQKEKNQKPEEVEKVHYDNTPYKSGGKLQMVIASSNAHKIEEMAAILNVLNIQLLALKDVELQGLEIEENGSTFEENAMIKAKEVMKRTGKIAIADDSGLAVEALGHRPGIYSARFSGEGATDQSNNDKLLAMMQGIPIENRKGKFISVIAVAFPDGREGHYKGICEGSIGYEPQGNNGFGYDPLFIVKGMDKTYAQLDAKEKNALSHRGRALKVMRKKFGELLGENLTAHSVKGEK